MLYEVITRDVWTTKEIIQNLLNWRVFNVYCNVCAQVNFLIVEETVFGLILNPLKKIDDFFIFTF